MDQPERGHRSPILTLGRRLCSGSTGAAVQAHRRRAALRSRPQPRVATVGTGGAPPGGADAHRDVLAGQVEAALRAAGHRRAGAPIAPAETLEINASAEAATGAEMRARARLVFAHVGAAGLV